MNEKEYDEIMAKIDGLMDAKPNTPEEAELERLSKMVEVYEDEHWPIEEPDGMITKSSRFINKRIGPFKTARWGKSDIGIMATAEEFKDYRLEFVGMTFLNTGYYIGFMIGRRQDSLDKLATDD